MKTIRSLWASISVNGRDIISTMICIVAVLFVTQAITSIGDRLGISLHDLKSFVFAVSKFAFVALCGVGYITHVTFRESLGEHDKNEFMDTWRNVLTAKERFEWFLKVSIAGLIVSVLNFTPRFGRP